jgi:hypothetical protein
MESVEFELPEPLAETVREHRENGSVVIRLEEDRPRSAESDSDKIS